MERHYRNYPRKIINMKTISVVRSLFLVLVLTLLAGCGDGSGPDATAPLSADNLNLIFVASPYVVYHVPGDIDPSTANLTNQGLQRSLLMATHLKQQVLGTSNVAGIYALEPMTHLQTANNYPDMAAIETISALLANINRLGGYNLNLPGTYMGPNYVYAISITPSGVASFSLGGAPTDPAVARATSDFFFTGGRFSNQTILAAWEHDHFPPLITALFQSYGGSVQVPPLSCPDSDYDTIWTVTLDAQGNATVNNALCEGIDSAALPATAPQF